MQNKNRKEFFIFGVSFCLSLFLIFPQQLTAAALTSEKIINQINLVRQENNLASLSAHNLLTKVAQSKVQDMIANNYFAHSSPSGKTAWDFIISGGYDFRFAGENLAMDYTNEKDLVQAWMQSNTHRKNILNANFQDTGVAVATGNQHILIVQIFGTSQFSKKTKSDVIDNAKKSSDKTDVKQSQINQDIQPTIRENEMIHSIITDYRTPEKSALALEKIVVEKLLYSPYNINNVLGSSVQIENSKSSQVYEPNNRVINPFLLLNSQKAFPAIEVKK
jgi:hypothetical protein